MDLNFKLTHKLSLMLLCVYVLQNNVKCAFENELHLTL